MSLVFAGVIKASTMSSLMPLIGTKVLPGGTSKEPACQYRRHKRHMLDPWVGKIPWRRE